MVENRQISGVFLSDTLGRGILRRSDKPGFVLLSQHITESGRGSELAKEVGAGRNNSDPVLTARHLVTDNEAASQETVFLFLFSPPPSSSLQVGRVILKGTSQGFDGFREPTVIHVDV